MIFNVRDNLRFVAMLYHDSIADALADLGKPDEIGKVFAGFQKYLYEAV